MFFSLHVLHRLSRKRGPLALCNTCVRGQRKPSSPAPQWGQNTETRRPHCQSAWAGTSESRWRKALGWPADEPLLVHLSSEGGWGSWTTELCKEGERPLQDRGSNAAEAGVWLLHDMLFFFLTFPNGGPIHLTNKMHTDNPKWGNNCHAPFWSTCCLSTRKLACFDFFLRVLLFICLFFYPSLLKSPIA